MPATSQSRDHRSDAATRRRSTTLFRGQRGRGRETAPGGDPTAAAATTLIVLVSDRAIVIGADSMRTWPGRNRSGLQDSRPGRRRLWLRRRRQRDQSTRRPSPPASSAVAATSRRRHAASLTRSRLAWSKTSDRADRGTRRELIDGTGAAGHRVHCRAGGRKPQGFLVLVLAEPAADGVTLTTKVDPLDTPGPERAIPELAALGRDRPRQSSDERKARAAMRELVSAAGDLVRLDLVSKKADASRIAGRVRRPASPCSIRMASVRRPRRLRRPAVTTDEKAGPVGPAESRCYLSSGSERGWCRGTESNRRHRDFQSRALPTELPRRTGQKRDCSTRGWPRTSPSHVPGGYRPAPRAAPAA